MSPQSQIGWRALLALAATGALAGFTVPAIASSLIQQERHQPSVRLLRAPRIPPSETQTPPSEAALTPHTRTMKAPRVLTLGELERRARRTTSPRLHVTVRPSPEPARAPAAKEEAPQAGRDEPPASIGTPKPGSGGTAGGQNSAGSANQNGTGGTSSGGGQTAGKG